MNLTCPQCGGNLVLIPVLFKGECIQCDRVWTYEELYAAVKKEASVSMHEKSEEQPE